MSLPFSCFGFLPAMLRKIRLFGFFLFFLMNASLVSAQVTIWSEDFNSYPDGTENGSGTGMSPANWYTTLVNDVWVQNGQIQANNVEASNSFNGQEGVWSTDPIDISGYGGVQFSFDVSTQPLTGEFEAGQDRFIGEYRVDGGAWVEFVNASGATPGDPLAPSYAVTLPSLGSVLEIQVRMYNTWDNEFYFLDNVLVTGFDASACSGNLNYEFYDLSADLTSVDDLPTSGALGSGEVSDFNIVSLQASIDPGNPDNYGVRYKGYIYIASAANYTFYSNSNDGSKIIIGGVEVVDNDHDGFTQEASGTIFLRSGFHTIEIPFFENGMSQILDISYESAALSIAKQAVPFSILFTCIPGITEIAATGDQYYCGSAPMPIAESVTITSSGATTLSSAFIQISSGYDFGEDLLSATALPSGVTATWDATQGKLVLQGTASLAEYESAIASITFETTNALDDTVKEFSIVLASANFLLATGHYYEYIPDLGITWTDARDQAALRSFYGLQGYLATITIPEEAVLLGEQAAGAGWIGASDAAVDDEWRWVTGPEAGTQFWQGKDTGFNTAPFFYSNWNVGEPNDYQGNGESYAHINAPGTGLDGSWNDLTNTGNASGAYQPKGYLVEYGGMPGDPEAPNISAVTTLTYGEVSIQTHPADQVIFAGDDVSFSVVADRVKTYQWQVSQDGGVTWMDIDQGDNPSAVTDTLTVRGVQVSQQDERYRVLVGNSGSGCTPEFSTEALLGVRVRMVITNRNKTFRVNRGG